MRLSIKVRCSECKRSYYTCKEQLGVSPQKKIRVSDHFSAGCPICEAGAYVCRIGTVEEAKAQHRKDKKRMECLKSLRMFIANASNKN